MYLFVYGTLLSKVPSSMAKFLRRRATFQGEASVRGQLYDLGMYPGFTTGGGQVKGELYELEENKAAQSLEMLDAYEGVTGEAEDEYVRKSISCSLADGSTVKAQTYVSKKIPSSARRIKDGDYLRFFQRNAEHQRFVKGGE